MTERCNRNRPIRNPSRLASLDSDVPKCNIFKEIYYSWGLKVELERLNSLPVSRSGHCADSALNVNTRAVHGPNVWACATTSCRHSTCYSWEVTIWNLVDNSSYHEVQSPQTFNRSWIGSGLLCAEWGRAGELEGYVVCNCKNNSKVYLTWPWVVF